MSARWRPAHAYLSDPKSSICAGVQALSVTMRKHTLEAASRNVTKLRTAVDKCKASNSDRLRAEYNRLVAGLQVHLQFYKLNNSVHCSLFFHLLPSTTVCATVWLLVTHSMSPHVTDQLKWYIQVERCLPLSWSESACQGERAAWLWAVHLPLECKSVLLRCAQERGVLNPVPNGEDFMANPVLPQDILREAVRSS